MSCWVSKLFFFLQVVGQRHLERHKPRWSSRAGCGSHVWACFSGSITTRNAGDVQTLVMIKPNYIKLWSLSMSARDVWSKKNLHIDFSEYFSDLIWVSTRLITLGPEFIGVANMAWALVFASPSGMHQALNLGPRRIRCRWRWCPWFLDIYIVLINVNILILCYVYGDIYNDIWYIYI